MIGSLLLAASVLLPAAPSSAATTGGSTLADLQAALQASSERIHRLSSEFASASAEVGSLDRQLAEQVVNLSRLERRAAASRETLRAVALDSYTGETPGELADIPDSGLGALVGEEYLSVASGTVSDSLDAYQLAERELATAASLVRAERAAARKDAAAAAAARTRAYATARSEQASLDAYEARLSAEAADRRRAPATQGGPVDGGLLAVVGSQTSGPSAAPPSSANDPRQPTPTTSAVPSTTDPPSTTSVSVTVAAPPTSPTTTSPPSTTSPPTTAAPTSTTSPPTTSPPVTTSPATTSPATTSPPTTSPPTTSPPTTVAPTGNGSGGVWYELRMCESGDNYQADTGNGYYGAYQFSEQTWTSLGYPGWPYLEPPAMQNAAAIQLQAEAGWGQWPVCAAELGLI